MCNAFAWCRPPFSNVHRTMPRSVHAEMLEPVKQVVGIPLLKRVFGAACVPSRHSSFV